MVVEVACLISLGSCRSRIADPEMPEWDDASIEVVLKKPNLKVLDIGNSYTNDATALLPTVVKNSGADIYVRVIARTQKVSRIIYLQHQ